MMKNQEILEVCSPCSGVPLILLGGLLLIIGAVVCWTISFDITGLLVFVLCLAPVFLGGCAFIFIGLKEVHGKWIFNHSKEIFSCCQMTTRGRKQKVYPLGQIKRVTLKDHKQLCFRIEVELSTGERLPLSIQYSPRKKELEDIIKKIRGFLNMDNRKEHTPLSKT
jgi:hypothetical protein